MGATRTSGGISATLQRLAPRGTPRRLLVQHLLGGGLPPILVASMSRSGSTLLFRSLRSSWTRARFGPLARRLEPFVFEVAWRLEHARFLPGVVYKTHDLPQFAPRDSRLKVLFTYRRATDVALSVANQRLRHGDGWFQRHAAHMGASGDYEAFLRRDTLGLERQIDRWTAAEGLDVLGLRYETLWTHKAELEAFVGFPVRLEKRTESGYAGVPPADAALIRNTYAPVDRKIEALPKLFRRTAERTPLPSRQVEPNRAPAGIPIPGR